MKIILCAIFYLCSVALLGQNFRHFDYLGAGHSKEIVVTCSSNKQTAQKTIDGFDIKNQEQLKHASRFLAQCTFGADMPTIRNAAAMGYSAWLDEQFELPLQSYTDESRLIANSTFDEDEIEEEDEEVDPNRFSRAEFVMAWLHTNLTHPDILRKRMSFILSQIFVINNNSDLFEDFGPIGSSYYDLLEKNAFNNYRILIEDVTLSPSMGMFLSHWNNPKEDLANNIHPDENYAREIMQLFSIGLWELNPDGSRKYDAQGRFIPTYTNADIKEFAQVFTGLGDGRSDGQFGGEFEDASPLLSARTPMKMYQEQHDLSSKNLLNGTVLPAGQNGMDDIRQTLDHLSNHPNTAPFIAKALIQFMTTSNPSPAYISNVTSAFNPSQEGNFKEVIKAILLDPEARNCNYQESRYFSKLRAPLTTKMNYMKAFHISPNEFQQYHGDLFCFNSLTGQGPLMAPSVFNFFRPDYQPSSDVAWNYLVAPEFQLLNSTNSIGMINEIDRFSVRRAYFENCLYSTEEEEVFQESEEVIPFEEVYFMDYSEVNALANNSEQLIDYLDILLANGLLEDETKNIIKNAINQLDNADQKIMMASYLIMISPDYAILK